jgi:imidazoleglycerol-phosphate dehydratase
VSNQPKKHSIVCFREEALLELACKYLLTFTIYASICSHISLILIPLFGPRDLLCYLFRPMTANRRADLQRETAETYVSVSLLIDGTGTSTIQTGIPFFDHMLTLFSRHSLFDLKVEVRGDLEVDYHHSVEDAAIVLGKCLAQALGDKAGTRRYGWVLLPMDETLVQVAVDLSGRSYLQYESPEKVASIGLFDFELVEEFLRAFSSNANLNLHVDVLHGRNSHHMAEGIFKGLAKALDQACQIDSRVGGIPSSKGTL